MGVLSTAKVYPVYIGQQLRHLRRSSDSYSAWPSTLPSSGICATRSCRSLGTSSVSFAPLLCCWPQALYRYFPDSKTVGDGAAPALTECTGMGLATPEEQLQDVRGQFSGSSGATAGCGAAACRSLYIGCRRFCRMRWESMSFRIRQAFLWWPSSGRESSSDRESFLQINMLGTQRDGSVYRRSAQKCETER